MGAIWIAGPATAKDMSRVWGVFSKLWALGAIVYITAPTISGYQSPTQFRKGLIKNYLESLNALHDLYIEAQLLLHVLLSSSSDSPLLD